MERQAAVTFGDFVDLLDHVGKDPSRLIFEDDLTGIHNRRFLIGYLEHRVRWETGDDYPLSLLIIDLDAFKEINDTYGHDTGDQALNWFATLLREVAGQRGLPVRWGGDEFALLLPRIDRDGARDLAERLLQRTRDRPFRLRSMEVSVPISLSIGVATAPDDAQSSKGLFHAADMALFHAKQSGRAQVVSAAEVDPEKVFPKTALYRLKATGIAGRDSELGLVSDALEKLGRGRSQFLILEGSAGMGKTTFLETIRRNLIGDDSFCVVSAAGDQREAHRPYYLTGRILLSLLNQREDKGLELIEDLPGEEIDCLTRVLPQLGRAAAPQPDDDSSAKRQAIFTTLARFLPKAVDFRPLVLIIDDLQFADDATLLLLRVLNQAQKLAVLMVGSSLEFLKLSGEQEANPLERFYALYHRELGIRRIKLQPLGEDNIAQYLRGVFPNLQTPDGFESQLADITQGNPLFLGEIIRNLVTDRKVTLIGQLWVVQPLEAGYLPRSLEEIVVQKIADLDQESRELLERASTLGEDVPVSVLAGSSELDEYKVQDFLDRAEALGLVSLDFQVNDEIMRFLSKRVLEISYGAIDQLRREGLHEQIGEYKEGLFEQRLLPSASLLAYHFKRSANEEKARRYEQAQAAQDEAIYSPDEAPVYASEFLEEEADHETRLLPESVPRVPNVLRTLTSAVRNVQLYPLESKKITQSIEVLCKALEEILDRNERLHLSHTQRVLLVNGQRLDISRFSILADAFRDLLTRSDLQGIVFERGVTGEETRNLVTKLGSIKAESIDRGFWKNYALESGLQHIDLRQVRYSRLRRRKGRGEPLHTFGEDEGLDPNELAKVPLVIRHLMGAAQHVKLYPLDSQPMLQAIEQLKLALDDVLKHKRVLTFAAASQSLLVNGKRFDSGGPAESLLDLMHDVALGSVSFGASVPFEELAAFLNALRRPPSGGYDGEFWDSLAQKRRLSHIGLNQRQYALGVLQSLLNSTEVPVEEAEEEGESTELAQRLFRQRSDVLRDSLPNYARELLVAGEHALLNRLLHHLFKDFQSAETQERARTVVACHTALRELILGLQHKFSELAADPLLGVLAEESEPPVLQSIANVLHDMSSCAVHFADYPMATRILLSVKSRQEQFEAKDTRDGKSLSRLLDRRLDVTAQKLLMDDLKSGQPARQERAAQVVGGLGRLGVPLLIEVIKQERDLRVRQLAANLLADLGFDAAEQIKRALVTEVTVEQRFRILEVIDTVTKDVRAELAYSFGDSSAKIRRAAFRAFERLNDDNLIDVVLPLAHDPDSAMAKGAIRSLANLRSPAAVAALVEILERTDEPRVATACCQALGELRHPSAIRALARVLGQRKLPFFRFRWARQVRATAAMALRQIPHHGAAEILARYKKDRDVRVRQLATSAAAAHEPS